MSNDCGGTAGDAGGLLDATVAANPSIGGKSAGDGEENNIKKDQSVVGDDREPGRSYAVTALRPDSVMFTERCSFLGPNTIDVVIARECRLEVRSLARHRWSGSGDDDMDVDADGSLPSPPGATSAASAAASSSFPVVLDLPIKGRLATLLSFRPQNAPSDLLFFSNERHQYAVISYDPVGQTTVTHNTGSLNDLEQTIRVTGREAQCGPKAAVDPLSRCIVVHLYHGYIKVLPILSFRSPNHPGGMSDRDSDNLDSCAFCGFDGVDPPPPGVLRNAFDLPLDQRARDPFNLRMDQHTLQSMIFLDAVRDDYAGDYYVAAPSGGTGGDFSAGAARGGIGAAVNATTMDTTSNPMLVMVKLDSSGVQHVVTYSLDLDKEKMVLCHRQGGVGDGGAEGAASFSPQPPFGPRKSSIDAGSGMVIWVPLSMPATAMAVAVEARAKASSSGDGASYSASDSAGSPRRVLEGGGIVIVGHNQLTYMNQYGGGTKVLPIEHAIMISYCTVPTLEGGGPDRRFLLGDDQGYLHVLTLTLDGGIVTSLAMETLGTNDSISSAVNYLDDGLVFMGSQFGDSQLVRLLTKRDFVTRSYMEVLEEYTNLGPIGGFDLLDLHGNERSQVVTSSGTAREGNTVRFLDDSTFEEIHRETTSAQHDMENLIRSRLWDCATWRVSTAWGKEELRRTNDRGELPLHLACDADYSPPPVELVEAMLREYSEATKVSELVNGYLPIDYHLCDRDNVNMSPQVVQLLVNAYPECARLCFDDGYLPLHWAANGMAPLEIMEILLHAHPKGAAARTKFGALPIHLLARSASPNKEGYAEKVGLLLRPLLDNEEACLISYPQSGETPLDIGAKVGVLRLHTCLKLPHCPLEITVKVALRYPEQLRESDDVGNFPLHVVASNPNMNGVQYNGEDFVGKLVKLYPEAAAELNADDRSPLTLAVESGKKWNQGVDEIVDAAGQMVLVRDKVTNLYPFMLAATSDNPCITTVYGLLRCGPELRRYVLN